jgi:hypothetical protein
MTTLEREGIGSLTIIAMLIVVVNCELANPAHLDNQAGTPQKRQAFLPLVIVYQLGYCYPMGLSQETLYPGTTKLVNWLPFPNASNSLKFLYIDNGDATVSQFYHILTLEITQNCADSLTISA